MILNNLKQLAYGYKNSAIANFVIALIVVGGLVSLTTFTCLFLAVYHLLPFWAIILILAGFWILVLLIALIWSKIIQLKVQAAQARLMDLSRYQELILGLVMLGIAYFKDKNDD